MGYADDVIADGPAAYYKLDDAGSTATDSSGNGRHGTHNGGVLRALRSPMADDPTRGMFYRTSQEAFTQSSSAAALAFTTSATIEAWMMWRSGTAVLRDSTNSNGWILAINSSGALHVRAGGTNFVTGLSTSVLQDGEWHHIALTKSGGAVVLYIDGSAVYSGSGAGNTAAAVPWRIARNGTSGSNVYGDLAFMHVAFYSYALTASQVAAHHRAVTVPYNRIDTMAFGPVKVRHIGGSTATQFEQTLPTSSLITATSPASPGTLATLGTYPAGTELRFRINGTDAQDNLVVDSCVVAYYPSDAPGLGVNNFTDEIDGPAYILWWENPRAGTTRDYNDLHSWVWTTARRRRPTVGRIGFR